MIFFAILVGLGSTVTLSVASGYALLFAVGLIRALLTRLCRGYWP